MRLVILRFVIFCERFLNQYPGMRLGGFPYGAGFLPYGAGFLQHQQFQPDLASQTPADDLASQTPADVCARVRTPPSVALRLDFAAFIFRSLDCESVTSMLSISIILILTLHSHFCCMQVHALGAPCDAYARGFETTHVSGAVIEAATDAEMEAIMTDIGIPAALRVQFRLVFAKWKGDGGEGGEKVDEVRGWGREKEERGGVERGCLGGFGSPRPYQVRPPVPAKKKELPKSKCGSCFGKGHVVCSSCHGSQKLYCHKCARKGRQLCVACRATGFAFW